MIWYIHGAAETLLKQAYLRPLPHTLLGLFRGSQWEPMQSPRLPAQHFCSWSRLPALPPSIDPRPVEPAGPAVFPPATLDPNDTSALGRANNADPQDPKEKPRETRRESAIARHGKGHAFNARQGCSQLALIFYDLDILYNLIYDLYDYICFAEGRRSSSQHQPTAWVTL